MENIVPSISKWLNFSSIEQYFYKWYRNYQTRQNIRQTIKELSTLSDKELLDIGLNRGDIWSVAHEVHDNTRLEVNKNLKGWV